MSRDDSATVDVTLSVLDNAALPVTWSGPESSARLVTVSVLLPVRPLVTARVEEATTLPVAVTLAEKAAVLVCVVVLLKVAPPVTASVLDAMTLSAT